MTIQNTTRKVRADGNGSVTAFAFSFKIFSASELEVYKVNKTTLVATLQTLTTHYTVSINTITEGGTVTFVTAPTSNEEAFIRRVLARTQTTDIPNVGSLRESQLENQFDREIMILQELEEEVGRTLRLSDTSTFSDLTVPEPSADKVLGWNSAATALENKTLTITATNYAGVISAGTDAAKPASPTAKDIYIALDTNKLYICFVGGTWSTARTFSDLITMSGAAVNHAKGSDIASATTTDIGAATGNFIHVTGTTTITGLGTIQAGTIRFVRFAGALTLTHNATSLILPGAANITTAANDFAVFVSEGSGNWRCVSYVKADGTNIADFLALSEISAPTTVANQVKVYAKDVSSVAELMVRKESSGAEVQLTKDGKINAFSRSKVIVITRDMATGSGNVAYTGVGFKPKALIAFGCQSSASAVSEIFNGVTSDEGGASSVSTDNGSNGQRASVFMFIDESAGLNQQADVVSWDSDGFTLAWTRNGGPLGTITIGILCLG